MKQILLFLVATALFIIVVGLMTQKLNKTATTSTSSTKVLTLGNTQVTVEIADTAALREKGLSGRTSLEANRGMLFVFPTKGVIPNFWMRNMLIPLDMIWISDSKVVQIDKNIAPPKAGTPDNQLSIYSPVAPVDYVLEVNAGFSDKNNIKVGAAVTF